MTHPGIGFILMTMITLTAGTAFIMWLGEQITERGIGNGMSLIIFAGIVVRLPSAIVEIYEKVDIGRLVSARRYRHRCRHARHRRFCRSG